MPPSVMDPDEYWVKLLDIVYAHVVLWDSVPPCPAVISLWLSRLVEYEVSCFFPLRHPSGSDDLQEGIIGTAGLHRFSEEQLDNWFSVFGSCMPRYRPVYARMLPSPGCTASLAVPWGWGVNLPYTSPLLCPHLLWKGAPGTPWACKSMLGLLCEQERCSTGGLLLVACLFLFTSDCTAVLHWNTLPQHRPYIPWSCMSCQHLTVLCTFSVLRFLGVALLCALCLAVSTRILFVSWRAPFGVTIFVWPGCTAPPCRPLLPMPPLMNPLLRTFILWLWSLWSMFLLSRELALPQLCAVAAGGTLVVIRAVVAITTAVVTLFPAVPDRCFCSA